VNLGIIAKSLREVWPGLLLTGVGMFAFELFVALVMAQFQDQLSQTWLELDFVRGILETLLGSELGGQLGPEALSAIAFVHPVALALTWGFAFATCTRMPAGEVDRGTIDVLLGMPVSRWSIYRCEALVWLVCGLVLATAGSVGFLVGKRVVGSPVDAGRVVIVAINFYALYVAVAGMTCLLSSLSNRRGRALTAAVGIAVASILLSFLMQFAEWARSISFLCLLNYHRPFFVLRDGTWPTADLLVLTLFGVACWSIGGVIFARRDVCTV
jgi:ABC-type transport system involved in multi-copper enzyme maturation permease subunit